MQGTKLLSALGAIALIAGCSSDPKTEKDEPRAGTISSKTTTTATKKTTLCERLGGSEKIEMLSRDFGENYVLKDDRINRYFAKTDLPAFEKRLAEQIGEACGCAGVHYTGKDMKTAHKGMGITNADFHALVEDLGRCLDANGIAASDRDELISKLAPMKGQIVEKEGTTREPSTREPKTTEPSRPEGR